MEDELRKILNAIMKQNEEILYSIRFHDSIKESWFSEETSLTLGRGAIDYCCAYVLFRTLSQLEPNNILECGMGQSTKIISSYAKKHLECCHRVVEHDKNWIDFFTKSFEIPEQTEIVELNIEKSEINFDSINSSTWHYVDFLEKVGDKKYDFILIDGPYGYNNPFYSRVDILSLVPNYLNDSFVIMMHDIYRFGEKSTTNLIKKKLHESSIEFCETTYENTGIIVSKNNKFLCTL